jgi:hypothetical protein
MIETRHIVTPVAQCPGGNSLMLGANDMAFSKGSICWPLSHIKDIATLVHGMQGFDYEKARIGLEIPDNFDVMAMIAIGKKDQRIICHNNFRKENILAIENLWQKL